MTPARPLMLVSAFIDESLRKSVAEGKRPRPEFLVLEESYGVELLDWSRLRAAGGSGGRSNARSLAHAIEGLRRRDRHSVILSDGEHVGIPLALALRSLRSKNAHLVIGHHMTTPRKANLVRRLRAHEGMSRILVHSQRQLELAHSALGIPVQKLAFIPYYADTAFWRPLERPEEHLVVAAGREHRDYTTLAEACSGIGARVHIASGSVHSPASAMRTPSQWPANFELGFADYASLRDLYSRASVVVVPVVETDFQAGVTTILEAMAAGKAVVATATSGQSPIIQDGVTGLWVAPGDVSALKAAVTRLLDNQSDRRRLGDAARKAVIAGYSVEHYARRLAGHMEDLAASRLAVA